MCSSRPARQNRSLSLARARARSLSLVMFGFLAVTPALGESTPQYHSFKAGQARAWQGAKAVTKYSSVSLRYGNLHTTIPLVGWSGTGPATGMVFYHNSLAPVSGLSTPATSYNLGAGWSSSYSARIYTVSDDLTDYSYKLLIDDDGTVVRFDQDFEGGWTTAPGFHLTLTQDGNGDHFVTAKDQSYRRFNSNGRLMKVVDASGNIVTVDYNSNGTTQKVTDATTNGGRTLDFHYDDSSHTTRLTSITAPLDGSSIRTWTLDYNTNSWISAIHDPMDHTIQFTYDSAARIRRVYDEMGNYSLITYEHGLVAAVNDPSPYNAQMQGFSYDSTTSRPYDRVYTDRRGNDWIYTFDGNTNGFDDELIEATDPLSNATSWERDSDHNVLTVTDALSNAWTYTYDDSANLLTATDPLGHKTAYEYDGLNNLTSVTPPLDAQGGGNTDKTVTIAYEDDDNPTRATSITEPADGQGSGTAVTTMTYYGPSDHPEWTGLPAKVTDPNGVCTMFDYDDFGQPRTEKEGSCDWSTNSGGGGGSAGDVVSQTSNNNCSWPVALDGPFGSGGMGYNGCGSLTGAYCYVVRPGFAHPSMPSNPLMPATPDRFSGDLSGGCFTATYDDAQRLVSASNCIVDSFTGESSERSVNLGYDEMDRTRSVLRNSTEATWDASTATVSREFDYTPASTNGSLTRTGPDGVDTVTLTDEAGRVTSNTRGNIETDYEYDDANRLTAAANLSNGTRIEYAYDDAGRLTQVRHRVAGGDTLLQMDYTHSSDGLITGIVESDATTNTAAVAYTYDRRNRLIGETRTGDHPYSLAYTYDLGGNRTTKTNNVTGDVATYLYDINSNGFISNNNRLMRSQLRDASSNLVETVTYAYHKSGHVEQIVTKAEAGATYTRVYFVYDKSGHTWLTVQDHYDLDTNGDPVNVVTDAAREFRYDGGRQRYLARDRNTNDGGLTGAAEEGAWSDYDGESIYGDFAVAGATREMLMRYEPGAWQQDAQTSELSFIHTDHIGTTRLMTDDNADATARPVFTAFGEPVDEYGVIGGPGGAGNSRYGYVGEHGYGGGSVWGDSNQLPYLHVGERLYDPSTGRFLQRDPIGISGGLNCYSYALSAPTMHNDPSGLDVWLEGGVHQRFCVGNPCGSYRAISFGNNGSYWNLFSWGDNGIVYEDEGRGGPRFGHLITTPKDDREINRLLDGLVGNRHHYALINYNCHHYTNEVYDYVKRRHGVSAPPAPEKRMNNMQLKYYGR